RRCPPGELSSFDLRQMFAYGVQFPNRGAGAQQKRCRLLFLFQRDSLGRGGPQSRTSPGDQNKDDVILAQSPEQLPCLVHRANSGTVGNRMGGLNKPNPLKRQCVAILRDNQPATDVAAQNFLSDLGHFRARLTGADDDQTAANRDFLVPSDKDIVMELKKFPNACGRICCIQRGLPNEPCRAPKLLGSQFPSSQKRGGTKKV